MILGAPTVQGRQIIAIQETYDLTGDNFYNPYWGYQTQNDGSLKKRNARTPDNHKPYMTLGHYWTVSDKLEIQSNLYAILVKQEIQTLIGMELTTLDLIIINTYQVIYLMIKEHYQGLKS